MMTGVGVASFPLDDFAADMMAAWSVGRRLLTNYAGALIRVRRDSDNTEQDISADAAGILDAAALTAFLGGSNGFLRYIYDQVGAKHYGQTTAARQPGVSLTNAHWGGSLPTAEFDGGDSMSTAATMSPTGILAGTSVTGGSVLHRVFADNAGASSVLYVNTNSSFMRFGSSTGQTNPEGAVNTPRAYEMYYNGATSITAQDGAELDSAADTPFANAVYTIGDYTDGGTQNLIGSITYKVALNRFYNLAERAAIRAAIDGIFF